MRCARSACRRLGAAFFMPQHWSFEKGNTIVTRARKRAQFPGPFRALAASPLLHVLLAAHILLARILLVALVLLARLAALLALLLAGLLTGFGLVLPLLLLTGVTRRLA